MVSKKVYILIILILLFPFKMISQVFLNDFPIKISIGDQWLNSPYLKIQGAEFSPSFSIGTEYKYLNSGKLNRYQTLVIGTYFNRHSINSTYIKTEFAFRYYPIKQAYLSANVGFGLLYSFSAIAIYEEMEGYFRQIQFKRKSFLLLSSAFECGYDFRLKNKKPLGIYFDIVPFIQIPYDKSLPKIPQTLAHIGCRFYI